MSGGAPWPAKSRAPAATWAVISLAVEIQMRAVVRFGEDHGMDTYEVRREIVDFYTSVYDEAGRLSATAHGVLELIRTREVLRRRLPGPPAAVLDVGGGPGTHAQWLATDGNAVHLVDPIPSHLERAASPASADMTELARCRRA
jgi:SAM-dependent methyltransferase